MPRACYAFRMIPTPVTLVSGFLGSGKTTLLNRTLGGTSGRRLGVLVNEFGTVGIDGTLLRGRGGDILELAGGCVCCKVGDDLRQATLDLLDYAKPTQVLLETSGVAEPEHVLEQLEGVPEVTISGLVCTVDVGALGTQLGARPEVARQIRAADRLLLTKLDTCDAEALARAHRELDELGAEGERAAFPPGRDDALLAGWVLEARPRGCTSPCHHAHAGGGQLQAAAVEVPGPLLEEPLRRVLEGLGERVYRVKGLLRLSGRDGTFLVELAGGRISIASVSLAGDVSLGTLVVIGEDLDEAALRRRLSACGVPG